MNRRSQPRALGDFVRTVRVQSTPQTPLGEIQRVWSDALGARIAGHADPVRERDGVVTVACSAATWAQELDLLQNELIVQLNRAIESGKIEQLRFVVGESQDFDTD